MRVALLAVGLLCALVLTPVLAQKTGDGTPDLAVTSATPDQAFVGVPLTFIVNVRNVGSFTSADSYVTNNLPAKSQFRSATGTGTTACSPDACGTQVSCKVPPLPPGDTTSIFVTVTPTAPGHMCNTAGIVSTGPELNLSNNATSGCVQVDPQGPPPSILSLEPNTGPYFGGTFVTIHGDNFLKNALVFFGGAAATNVTLVDSKTLTVRSPHYLGGPVTVDVTVQNPDQQSGVKPGAFTYVLLQVTSITPPHGPESGGTDVTIRGQEFQSGASVRIGGSMASVVVFVDSTTLTAKTPPYIGGNHTVNVDAINPDGFKGTLVNGFTYDPSAPPPRPSLLGPDVTSVVAGRVFWSKPRLYSLQRYPATSWTLTGSPAADLSRVNDGNEATIAITIPANQSLILDAGSPRRFGAARIIGIDPTPGPTPPRGSVFVTPQYADDPAGPWTAVSPVSHQYVNFQPDATGFQICYWSATGDEKEWPDVGAHRYWRLRQAAVFTLNEIQYEEYLSDYQGVDHYVVRNGFDGSGAFIQNVLEINRPTTTSPLDLSAYIFHVGGDSEFAVSVAGVDPLGRQGPFSNMYQCSPAPFGGKHAE